MNTSVWHHPRSASDQAIERLPNEALYAVGTGIGAILCGAATGALAGTLAGAVGMGVGAVIGAVGGGLAGRRVAEEIDYAANIIPF